MKNLILQTIGKSLSVLTVAALVVGTFGFSTTTAFAEHGDDTVKVTIHKYVEGEQASSENASDASFPMSATWNAEHLGAGSGSYELAPTNPTPYEAATVDMATGADYMTSENLDGPVVGASCDVEKPFALVGYTSGDTLAEAQSATPTTTAPSFTDMTSDKFVIVWNETCDEYSTEGPITGEVTDGPGILQVTSIEAIDTGATADNTYENGWEYIFHITVPTDEPNVAMKFSDWMSDSGTMPVGGNMRISSQQADNGGATVTVVAANTYTTPNLHMTSDLDAGTPGIQIEVVVEVKIPVGTPNDSYTTTYGVTSE